MANITRWDKFRAALGLGYSKETTKQIEFEHLLLEARLKKQAEERIAKLKQEAAAAEKAKATPAAKPAAKKAAPKAKPAPAAKTSEKKTTPKKNTK